MTKILVLSDLHAEMGSEPADLPRTESCEFDVVAIPGDVTSDVVESIAWAENAFDCPVVLVAGPREYFKRHRKGAVEAGRERASISPNVTFLEDDSAIIQGIRFVGATLWTDFRLFGRDLESYGRLICEESVLDYQYIWGDRFRSMPFTTGHAQAIHFESLAYIRSVLATPYSGPTVVVTHHAPHRRSISHRAPGDVSSVSCSSDLERDIAAFSPSAWIHGCVHDSVVYEVGSTQIACNARGIRTPLGFENERFDPAMVLQV